MASSPGEAQTPVNLEAIKTLCGELGIRKAAAKLQINPNTLLSWSSRDPNGPWPTPNSKPGPPKSNQSAITPSQAITSVLEEDSNKTKVGLSKYARRQAEHLAEKGKLKDHFAFKSITSGSSQLHGWEEKQSEGNFNLNVLSGQTVIQVGTANQDQS